MKIEILDAAESDLAAGAEFYERQQPGLGAHFLTSLCTDIDALQTYAGVHAKQFGYHRMLSKRFPFAIYYRVGGGAVQVYAVLDCRRSPAWIRERLT